MGRISIGTSLIRNTPLLGFYSKTKPRVLWWSQVRTCRCTLGERALRRHPRRAVGKVSLSLSHAHTFSLFFALSAVSARTQRCNICMYVHALFRALSGRLKFTVRRHEFDDDAFSCGKGEWGVGLGEGFRVWGGGLRVLCTGVEDEGYGCGGQSSAPREQAYVHCAPEGGSKALRAVPG